MNKKGFMMAELIVVSSIILVSLVSMYGSFIKIHSAYKTKMSYYDVATLYRLGYYRDVLKENKVNDTTSKLDEIIESMNSTNNIVEIYNSEKDFKISDFPDDDEIKNVYDRVFIIYNKKYNNPDEEYIINVDGFDDLENKVHVTFLDYVNYLNGNINNYSDFEYMMIMERCNKQVSGDIDDTDNCKYAYLEILNDVES